MNTICIDEEVVKSIANKPIEVVSKTFTPCLDKAARKAAKKQRRVFVEITNDKGVKQLTTLQHITKIRTYQASIEVKKQLAEKERIKQLRLSTKSPQTYYNLGKGLKNSSGLSIGKLMYAILTNDVAPINEGTEKSFYNKQLNVAYNTKVTKYQLHKGCRVIIEVVASGFKCYAYNGLTYTSYEALKESCPNFKIDRQNFKIIANTNVYFTQMGKGMAVGFSNKINSSVQNGKFTVPLNQIFGKK